LDLNLHTMYPELREIAIKEREIARRERLNLSTMAPEISKRAKVTSEQMSLVSEAAIEDDLIKKYPHLKKYILSASNSIDKKFLKWFTRELNKYLEDYNYTYAKLFDYLQEFKSNISLLPSKDIYNYTLESLEKEISKIKEGRAEADTLANKYFELLKEKREEYSEILPRDEARYKAYQDIRDWLEQIQPKFLQKLVRKQIRSKIQQREVNKGSEEQARAMSDNVFEDENYLVVLPGTSQASKYFGSGTQWCTTAEKNNQFINYSQRNIYLYYIIDKLIRLFLC